MKTSVGMIVLGFAGLFVLAGCAAKPADLGAKNGGNAGRRFATIPVQAFTVVVSPLVTENDTAGTVVPVTQSQVAAQVAGVVSVVVRKAGDWVKQGALIVQLEDSALKLAIKNAQSALANAKINLTMGQQTATASNPRLSSQLESATTALAAARKNADSQQKLFDLGGIASSQLDSAKSQLQQAQANVQAAQLALDQNQQSDTQSTAQLQLAVDQAATQLEMAQLNLRNAQITAPFAGQIAAINVTPGSYVSLNTSVLTLVSGDKEINFNQPPADAPNFKVGDEVTFTLGGKSYPVRIIQAPSAPINGVVPMVAALPPSVPAPYGAIGTITYQLTLAIGPQIPVAALQTRADMTFVYSIVNGKAVEQPITILAEGGTTAVAKGVEAGMQVILNPPPGLLAGSSVQAVALPSAQGTAPAAPAAAAPAGSGRAGVQGPDQKNRGKQ